MVTYVHNWSWVTGPEESYTVGLDLDVTTCSGSQAFSQMSLLVSRVSENEQHLTEAPFTLKSLCRWEEHTLTVGTCGQMCLYSESLLASWLWTSGHVVSLLIDAERHPSILLHAHFCNGLDESTSICLIARLMQRCRGLFRKQWCTWTHC